MSQVTLTTDDVVEAFCRMLEPGVKKGVLPREDCNRYGIDVLYHKKDDALIMFHFITKDMLEVNLELDLMELQRRGKEYLDHLYGILCDQTEQARKVRQEENSITIHSTGSHVAKQAQTAELPPLKQSVAAHNDALSDSAPADPGERIH